MLDLLNLFKGTERKGSSSDTPNEVEFACIYFSYYPYLNTNA